MARLLVVDDDPDILKLLEVVFTQEGHKVICATDGETALEVIKEEPPELCVLDVMMPKKDGFMVLKELKASGLRDTTKILLLTARTTEADWLRGYRLGADRYVTKPFDNDELVKAVDDLLGMDREEIRARRQQELDRAQLLSRLESLFESRR